MSARLPVVAVGGGRVDQSCGIPFVATDNEAIGRLACDADLRRRLGQNALTRAREQFCQKKQAESIVACYERWLREVP